MLFFGINFDTLSTTFQPIQPFQPFQLIIRALLTCQRHNKMTQCQIFVARTAPVHHLLSEIRISHLYTS